MKIDYACKNDECECEFEIRFSHSTPDRFMGGRMEDAEQGSSAEADPSECPECGSEVDVEELDNEDHE